MTLLRRYRYANGSSSWGEPPSPLASPLGRRPDCPFKKPKKFIP
ncbi:hypothetical protein [Nostoc sp.]